MGRGSYGRDDLQPAKIINVISVNSVKDKKQKFREATERWKDTWSGEYMWMKGLQWREVSKPLDKIELEVCFGNGGLCKKTSMKFIVVRAPSPYNIILGRSGLKILQAISSTIHSMMKFPTPTGIATLVTRTVIIAECRRLEKKQMIKENPKGKGEVAVTEEVLVKPSFPDQLVTIGGGLSETCRDQLRCLLKDNMSVFAWESSDMTGVPRRVIEHALNVNPSLDPVCQKQRTLSMEKSRVVTEEVAEWVKSSIVRSVKYPTYISNPVLVKKGDGTWRMCIDFKNLNSACPKDYFPLLNIDYEEKTAFYTDQGTYCYTKMPFGLKNAGATYQRLVDSTFQSQIGRNLEAYVDDMVIKSGDEKMLLADIAETFDNIKNINMKLNPKKCSFGVEEGKFLGYMVTSEGIRANPRKTRALADLQSPRMLKEMQNLNGKLASLSRFLAKSAERSLPFLNTLKNITKENKHEYRWTQKAEAAFQQIKMLIKELPSLTPPREKETLYAYLAVLAEAVSAVLLTDKKGRQCPLGAYNIKFIPRNAVKGQVLADFLSEAPEGTQKDLYFRMPEVPVEKDDTESWTLFTDGASSPKGAGAGLVLIGPNIIEYTYALRLTFPKVKVDFKLVASQINRDYEASKDSMIKYLAKAKEYVSGFKSFSIENIPRNMNQKADVLSKLASVAFNRLTKEVLVEILNERSTEGQELKDKNKARCLRAKIGQYTLESGVLFKKGYLVPMLRCVCPLQANYVIREIHMGSCGMHVGPRTVWGMNILGPLPPARGGAKFVIVAIDYFTKWIEAKPLVKITGKEVIRFVMDNIFCKFGLPKIIFTDNRAQLVNDPFKSWCGRFEIHQINTAVAHPQANGLVERANRSLMEGIKTRLEREKAEWVDELPNVLWAHRTSIKQSNGETPFSLTYGSETVIPAEIGIPTYQTLMIREGYNEEEMRLNLDLLQERREAAVVREARYKTKMEQYYNKKVRPAGFRPGEFVYRRNEASRVED
ncbi:reverse transcriptase domain-containing protein [Tanacetum coccineum]